MRRGRDHCGQATDVAPPPLGDRRLAQKAEEILGAEGTEENFSFRCTGIQGVADDRQLVTVSPSPQGDRHALGGEIARGTGPISKNQNEAL